MLHGLAAHATRSRLPTYPLWCTIRGIETSQTGDASIPYHAGTCARNGKGKQGMTTGGLILVGLPQVQIQHRDEGRDDDRLKYHHRWIITDFGLDCKGRGVPEASLSYKNTPCWWEAGLGRWSVPWHNSAPAGTILPHGTFSVSPLWPTGTVPAGAARCLRGYRPKAFCICWRTRVRRLTSPPPTSAVAQPAKPISSSALRTSAHGRSSFSLVMSPQPFLARL
jgi:hypothetical protein